MGILFVLIVFMLAAVVIGKFKFKSNLLKYVLAAVIALAQTLFIVYEMMTMKLPWS